MYGKTSNHIILMNLVYKEDQFLEKMLIDDDEWSSSWQKPKHIEKLIIKIDQKWFHSKKIKRAYVVLVSRTRT